MENNIQLFKHPEFGKVRVVMIEGEPWFVGKDVAKALGYKKPENAVKQHVPDKYKLSHQIGDSGQKRNVTLINEAGMYKLVMRSKLESAEKFSDWVCGDVLILIRKTGSYSLNKNDRDPLAVALSVDETRCRTQQKNPLRRADLFPKLKKALDERNHC